ncbi:helix-turn-helix domain-containing protein [Alphaproteobacteria bacterium]|nr:helix-turn-helix domain-containing protein [Alphaproteobacteria bacterium]MDA9581612.1 helix-turn-helix domain-containing protein [bacterium]MDA8625164.1 helix-turn-helix domain-containing protein [Alphaproteobacteria bacterium]MDA8642910.1 helix-turn-helix domain-containing protein [Alphaproteobacteria bacterium]MDA8667278.1 helix-turn-helix domain-containing protein [Alphaproteobacteria bacterium]
MPRNKERTLGAYIGAKVRMRRLMLNMSQETLSGTLGVTFQQVQKYEKGLNCISASRLFELALVLGVPVGYFYEGLEESDALARVNGAKEGLQDSPAVSPLMEFISSGPGVELNQAYWL